MYIYYCTSILYECRILEYILKVHKYAVLLAKNAFRFPEPFLHLFFGEIGKALTRLRMHRLI